MRATLDETFAAQNRCLPLDICFRFTYTGVICVSRIENHLNFVGFVSTDPETRFYNSVKSRKTHRDTSDMRRVLFRSTQRSNFRLKPVLQTTASFIPQPWPLSRWLVSNNIDLLRFVSRRHRSIIVTLSISENTVWFTYTFELLLVVLVTCQNLSTRVSSASRTSSFLFSRKNLSIFVRMCQSKFTGRFAPDKGRPVIDHCTTFCGKSFRALPLNFAPLPLLSVSWTSSHNRLRLSRKHTATSRVITDVYILNYHFFMRLRRP